REEEDAEHHDDAGQHQRADRARDREAGDAAVPRRFLDAHVSPWGAAAAAGAAPVLLIRTAAPSRSWLLPAVTTISLPSSPATISARPLEVRPVSTVRRMARSFSTT